MRSTSWHSPNWQDDVRRVFAETLQELAGRDSRIVLLTGDLGYTILEGFQKRFPARFFNVGVAEQNMVGIATGLAEAGFLPYVYSIAPFAVLRPYEFIRNGPILHHLPVRIVGVGGGFEYGHNGLSHYALEDIGVLRLQPGIMVICPADRDQARTSLRATYDVEGPVYYRLSKDESTRIEGLDDRFSVDQIQMLRDGPDLLIVSMGPVTKTVVGAADELVARGVRSAVAVVACVAPAPVHALAELLAKFRHVLTVEEHYCTGGLGSLVSEVVAERGLGCRVVRRGVNRAVDGLTGSVDYLRQVHGLSRDAIVDAALHQLDARYQ